MDYHSLHILLNIEHERVKTVDRRDFISGLMAMGCKGCASPGRRFEGEMTLRIAHCGDPQFGMGRPRTSDDMPTNEGYRRDLFRFEQEIEVLNGLDLDFVYIAGDMTHIAADVTRDWPRLLKKFRHPVVVAPGNHDMGNRLTAENADRFVSVFGLEYQSFEVKGWRVIVGNSQYWRPTAETARTKRYEEWVLEQLDDAKRNAGGRLILATHIPPFVIRDNEPDSYENFPLAGRAARLARYADAGAQFYLAGHTHTMIQRGWKNMTLLNAENTCMNFDERPFGCRLLTIRPDASFDWEFRATN